ncbi:MAG: hypothetical protein HY094_05845 [Candidatus Melainabacteria bacterium]|nr:hypothetical protein [Candidatus Melainabacteria bacterium]
MDGISNNLQQRVSLVFGLKNNQAPESRVSSSKQITEPVCDPSSSSTPLECNPQFLLCQQQVQYLNSLKRSGVTEDKLEVYLDAISYHLQNGWGIDRLATSFKKILDKNDPTSDKWLLLVSGINHHKSIGKGLGELVENYNHFFNQSQGLKHTHWQRYLGAFKNTCSVYMRNKWELQPLVLKFGELVKAGLGNKEFKNLDSAIRGMDSISFKNNKNKMPAEALMALAKSGVSSRRLGASIKTFYPILDRLQGRVCSGPLISSLTSSFVSLLYITSSEKELEISLNKTVDRILNFSEKFSPFSPLEINIITELVKLNLSSEEWESLEKILDYNNVLETKSEDLAKSCLDFFKIKPKFKILNLLNFILDLNKEDKTLDLKRLLPLGNRLEGLNLDKEQIKCLTELIKYEASQKFEIYDLIDDFIGFIGTKPTNTQLGFFNDLLDHYKKQGWEISVLIKMYTKLLRGKSKSDDSYLSNGIYLGTYLKDMNEFILTNFRSDKETMENSMYFFATFSESQISFKGDFQELNLWKEKVAARFKNGFKGVPAPVGFEKLYRSSPKEEEWKIYYDTIEKLYKIISRSEESKDLRAFFSFQRFQQFNEIFAELISNNVSMSILETFKNIFLSRVSVNRENELQYSERNESKLFKFLAKHIKYPATLEGYKAISQKVSKGALVLSDLIREAAIHSAICSLIDKKSSALLDEARGFLQDTVRNDHTPYPQVDSSGRPHPMATKLYKETLATYARAFDIYHGFGSLTYETKRLPNGELPLLYRFGKDSAEYTGLINAGDPNAFPGKGFFISGLNPVKIFASDKDAIDKDRDPLEKYKKAWPWAKDQFEDLLLTDFIFTRGFIAVSCRNSNKYNLDGVDYSYVVFNDHHHNYGLESAFLVPSKIIYEKLKGTITIPGSKHSIEIKDINQSGLTPFEIIQAALQINTNILNLGWGSNIGGSLSNAYPPNSLPYHKWEKDLKGHHTQDIYGHIHKSHILGRYMTEMTPELEKAFVPLRQAHDGVYNVSHRYQNLLDLFRLSLSLWHKGFTIGEAINNGNNNMEEDEEQPQELELIRQEDETSLRQNTRSIKMLIEAYKWHRAKDKGATDPKFFPVWTVCDALKYSVKPTSKITLDTFDMKLNIDGNVIQLPLDSDGTGSFETKVWFNNVMPHITSSSKDIRFYNREDLGN